MATGFFGDIPPIAHEGATSETPLAERYAGWGDSKAQAMLAPDATLEGVAVRNANKLRRGHGAPR